MAMQNNKVHICWERLVEDISRDNCAIIVTEQHIAWALSAGLKVDKLNGSRIRLAGRLRVTGKRTAGRHYFSIMSWSEKAKQSLTNLVH